MPTRIVLYCDDFAGKVRGSVCTKFGITSFILQLHKSILAETKRKLRTILKFFIFTICSNFLNKTKAPLNVNGPLGFS